MPPKPKDISLAPFGVWLGTCGLFILAVILTAGGIFPVGWVFAALALMVAAFGWMRLTRLRFERLHPPGVDLVPLTDSPEDGIVEEHGWVPLGLASTPKDAIRVLSDTYPDSLEPHFSFVVTGKSFHRPDEHIKGQVEGYFILDKDGPEDHEGRTGQWSEWITWQACEKGDDRAVECWDLEVREDGMEVEDA